MKKKPLFVFGTRPEIIKISKLVQLLESRNEDYHLVNTGQHYSPNMSKVFLKQLGFPSKGITLGVGGISASEQISLMTSRLSKLIAKLNPSIVLAEGDTNSVLSSALASSLAKTPFGHIEAGLRSFDRSMPEEINRIVADQLAQYNFAPTTVSVKNLKNSEALPSSIHKTGNTIVEVTRSNLRKASECPHNHSLEKNDYYVLTLHRAENTDNLRRLSSILKAVSKSERKVIFPVHPRTLKIIKKNPSLKKLVSCKNILLTAPLPYLEFLSLCRDSRLLLSDSGGIQEEASVYKKPVIILRENTERPEILGKYGWLAGYDTKNILRLMDRTEDSYSRITRKMKSTPFGDGKASQRILKILSKHSLL